MQINIGSDIELNRSDCLQRMRTFPPHSVDLVLCDLPYGGVTGCTWDVAIDLVEFWRLVRRVLKRSGVVVAFGAQPFSSALVTSNLQWFRYSLVWEKSRPTGFLHCWHRPLAAHEDIHIFFPRQLRLGAAERAHPLAV